MDCVFYEVRAESKNQFSMEHVMQLSSLWGMVAIWDGHFFKLKVRAFVNGDHESGS